jgi:glycerol-3-phosphate dehydrogenase (NAD(P)+)
MKIGVVGGGAWGTALAQVAAYGGRDTLLWAMEDAVVSAVNHTHENPVYLKGCKLDPAIRATTSFSELGECEAWIVVTPAQHMRAVLSRMPCPNMPLILCSKGIEEGSGKMLHEVAHEVCPTSPIAVLSGPSFAHEVADGLPTAVTLACEDQDLAKRLRERLSSPAFRIYLSDDVVGAEVGGAVKNVLAIACGIAEGRNLGQNARAALIARGFMEMTRFALAQGARRETLAGLAGLGDLVLTCSSTSSRNFSLGKGIGEGRPVAELMADRTTVAEGAFTAPVLARIARDMGVEMPIVFAVDALISGAAGVDEVLEQLLTRPPRAEGI